MDSRPIGIFDSGIGGFTVLREMLQLLPHEDFIYFGDTARVPYGNKSKSTIIRFTTENILFLLRKKVKIVVVACNTASALALDYVQGVFHIPLVGVIEAGVMKALAVSENRRIGVIGTRSTIESGSYQKLLSQRDRHAVIFSRPCPLFVPLVEEGITGGSIALSIIRMYLRDLKNKNIDTLILGCTHYPLLAHSIGAYLSGIKIIDSAKEVARHTKLTLSQNQLFAPTKRRGQIEFYVSDESGGFSKLAKLFLRKAIPKPRIANV